jgi:predicted cupin superfamily sugar epimerase
MMTADDIIRRLGLEPLPEEGGFFAETYRSPVRLEVGVLPAGYGGPRSISTAIYYLVTPTSFSRLHRLRSDEVFHYYAGDPAEMLQLGPGAESAAYVLGADIATGQRPQLVVPAGTWQGLRPVTGGRWTLLGTTVAPGFSRDDYEHGDRATLLAGWPRERARIEALTR